MKSTDNAGAAGFMYASVASRIMEQAIQQGVEAGVKAGAEYIEGQRRQAKRTDTTGGSITLASS